MAYNTTSNVEVTGARARWFVPRRPLTGRRLTGVLARTAGREKLFISFLEQDGISSSRLLGAIHGYIGLAKRSFRIQFLESEKAYSYTGSNM